MKPLQPVTFATKLSLLFQSLDELEKVCRRRPEDVKAFYLALATTLGHYKEIRRPTFLSLVPPLDHGA